MAKKSLPSDFKERRALHNVQRENTSRQRIGLQKKADIASVLKDKELTQDKIDFIFKNEHLFDCGIYVLRLLAKRAWQDEINFWQPEIGKVAKKIIDMCSDQELEKLNSLIDLAMKSYTLTGTDVDWEEDEEPLFSESEENA